MNRYAVIALLGSVVACSRPPPHEPSRTPTQRRNVPALEFHYEAIDGTEVSSDHVLGRSTIVIVITTYDLGSQAQARIVAGLCKRHVPRINCYAIVVEPIEDRPLVEAFVSMLHLGYPVVHLQQETFARGAFREMRSVPSTIILDPGGRVTWGAPKLATEQQLEQVLLQIDRQNARLSRRNRRTP